MCMNFSKALLGICKTKPLSSKFWKLENGKIRVRFGLAPVLSNKGDAVYLKGAGLKKPILLVRTEDDVYLAFANRCTHAGRKLDPVPGERMLRCCSIRHSTYDYYGNKIKGPGKKRLTSYPAEFIGEDLIITL